MERKQPNKIGDYDIPIEKPIGELPAWFVTNLNARLVTKRFPKDRDAKNVRFEGGRRTGLNRSMR